jgi:hypothetical protein
MRNGASRQMLRKLSMTTGELKLDFQLSHYRVNTGQARPPRMPGAEPETGTQTHQ